MMKRNMSMITPHCGAHRVFGTDPQVGTLTLLGNEVMLDGFIDGVRRQPHRMGWDGIG